MSEVYLTEEEYEAARRRNRALVNDEMRAFVDVVLKAFPGSRVIAIRPFKDMSPADRRRREAMLSAVRQSNP